MPTKKYLNTKSFVALFVALTNFKKMGGGEL